MFIDWKRMNYSTMFFRDSQEKIIRSFRHNIKADGSLIIGNLLRGSRIHPTDYPVGSSTSYVVNLWANNSSNSTESNGRTHSVSIPVIEIVVGTILLVLLLALLFMCVWCVTTENARGICMTSISRIAPPPPPPEFEFEESPSLKKRTKPLKETSPKQSSKGRKRSVSQESFTDLMDDLEEVPLTFADTETKSGKLSRQSSLKKSGGSSGKTTKLNKKENNKVKRKKSVSFKL
jgi:hypothetical protein